jgi:glycosyltransferase involved in cell wall biosynthesis
MPLVSVVIPTHNRTTTLVEAAGSVLSQTVSDIELIIVASASTAETLETARQIAATDRRCSVIDLRKDSLAGARNAGIMAARGEWVAFLDDDDVWLPNKLERQLSVDADMVNCDFIESGGELDGHIRHVRPPAGLSIAEGFVFGNYGAASASGAMVRTNVIRSLNGFDETLNGCEDWDMWRRISWWQRVVFLDEALVVISRHTGSMQVKKRALFYKSFLMHTFKTIRDTPQHLRHMIKPLMILRIRSAISHIANRMSGGRVKPAWRYLKSLRRAFRAET